MKKQLYFFVLLTCPLFITAQNVGIGTITPTEKLEIKNPLRSTLKISAGSLADTTQLILSNSGSPAVYTDFSIKSIREEGLFFSSKSDLPTYNSVNSLVIRPQGNVGIGNSLPAFKLDVSGDINTTGLIRLNGATGTAGQVLSSNGASDPAWVDAAYGNNTRFAYGISQFSPATGSASTGGQFTFGTAKYNLDPASVSVSGTTLTISKTGLYHFELFYNVQFYYASSATSISPLHTNYITINYAGSFNPSLAYFQEIRRESTTSNAWHYNGKASLDIYIQAPRTISINSTFTDLAGPTNSVIQDGLFYGHLINE